MLIQIKNVNLRKKMKHACDVDTYAKTFCKLKMTRVIYMTKKEDAIIFGLIPHQSHPHPHSHSNTKNIVSLENNLLKKGLYPSDSNQNCLLDRYHVFPF